MDKSDIITFLSSLLTGGFLLLFIESQKTSSGVQDRFRCLMNPFYDKLNSYIKFVYLFRQGIYIDSTSEEIEVKNLKHDLDYISDLYENADFPTIDCNPTHLDNLCNRIYNIWYYLTEKKHITYNYVRYDPAFAIELEQKMRESIEEIDVKYKRRKLNISFLSELSGDFYANVCEPVRKFPHQYECWLKKERFCRYISLIVLCVTLMSLLLIILAPSLRPCWLSSLIIMSGLLFVAEVAGMIYLDNIANRMFRFEIKGLI